MQNLTLNFRSLPCAVRAFVRVLRHRTADAKPPPPAENGTLRSIWGKGSVAQDARAGTPLKTGRGFDILCANFLKEKYRCNCWDKVWF